MSRYPVQHSQNSYMSFLLISVGIQLVGSQFMFHLQQVLLEESFQKGNKIQTEKIKNKNKNSSRIEPWDTPFSTKV